MCPISSPVSSAVEGADGLAEIQALAPKLRGDDITAVLNVIVCDTQIPAYKRKYLEKPGSLAPSPYWAGKARFLRTWTFARGRRCHACGE